jgi:transcriptional regulator with XRE-family HTH domain
VNTRSPRVRLGDNIRQRRTQLGISLRELARRTRLSPPYISQIELGQTVKPPLQHTIVRIGEALGATEQQIDAWVALTGKIRSSRILAVLNDERVLTQLHEATGLPIQDLRRLVVTTVEGRNEWPP